MEPKKSVGRTTQPTLLGFDDAEHRGDSGPTKIENETCSDPANAESVADASCQIVRETETGAAQVHELAPETSGGLPDLKERLVVVVDSHSLIYQVFHALPPMSSPSGQPVSAVYGFFGDLLELVVRKKPDYLFCAFDKSEETFRNALYDQYKAHRESMPDDLRQQIPLIRDVVSALGFGILECGGYEADDILATIAAQTESAGGKCLVVTSDKDCRQLITEKTHLYNIRKNSEMGVAELIDDWGIRPEQVVDFQAMVGDPVDNVPGIPLVGPKLAQQLLQQFGSLEQILQNTDQISGPKRRQNVESARDRVMLSRQLVKLCSDVPCETDWSTAKVGNADLDRVEQLCDTFGFRRLKARSREVLGAGEAASEPLVEQIDFSGYRCIDSIDELDKLVEELSHATLICFDTETTGTNARQSDLVGISVAWKPGAAAYIPVRAPRGDVCLDQSEVLARIRPVLENPDITKVGQNVKYDLIVLRSAGVNVRGVVHDTMVADYLIEPNQRNHSLDDLAQRYLSHKTISIKELIGTGKNQKCMDEVSVAEVATYAAEDADIPLRLVPLLQEKLVAFGLEKLYQETEIPLIAVLAEMEFNGIRVDVEKLASLSAEFSEQIENLREEIFKEAGCPFNIDSPKQLASILFEQLGLPVVKKTKTGPSTDAEVLQELSTIHPLPERIVAYRQLMKLKNTYVDALPQLVCTKTDRIHTSFRQDVAATGRLSSSEPNLQNIPIRTEQGKAIRGAFTAGEPGWLLLGADYSQIELRVLAHYCGDEALRRAYLEDADIHRRVAAEVHGVDESEVTDAMRRMAKTINFGIVYGQSPFGLAKTLGIEKGAAAEYIELYFARYPGVQQFMLDTWEFCRREGYVTTMLGRRRPVQGVRDFSKLEPAKMRSLTEPERVAVNTVIQGSAADIIKLAMLEVYQRLNTSQLSARLLLQIHDELLFEVAPDDVDSLTTLVSEAMTSVVQLEVPLKVDVAAGQNWAEV